MQIVDKINRILRMMTAAIIKDELLPKELITKPMQRIREN